LTINEGYGMFKARYGGLCEYCEGSAHKFLCMSLSYRKVMGKPYSLCTKLTKPYTKGRRKK